jgi:hypothetical protein
MCSDLKLQVERARREKLLSDQRADRFEKQATQLSQKYKAVDLDVYNSLQEEHAQLTQQLAETEARAVLLQQQVEEQQTQAAAQLQEAAQERQAELGRMQVGFHWTRGFACCVPTAWRKPTFNCCLLLVPGQDTQQQVVWADCAASGLPVRPRAHTYMWSACEA